MQSVHIFSHTYSMLHGINLLWPSDTRWRHRSWSTLARAHYLNQCSLFTNKVLWNPAGSNFTATAQATILCNEFENYTFKIIATSLTDQWVDTTADLLIKLIYWNTMTGNNSSTDVSLSRLNVKIKCKKYLFISPVGLSGWSQTRWYSEEFPDWAITYHTYQHTADSRSGKYHRQNGYLTAMFGHYIRRYLNHLIRLQYQISPLIHNNNTNTLAGEMTR